jgi:hypothetical protein
MLFDLRGRGRRNVVKVVYITLAVLMGGGLVLFGIGGATSGGLVDAITGSNGGDVGADRYQEEITKAQATLKTDLKNEVAWVALIRAQVSLASTDEQYDPNTGAYTEAGQADLQDAITSWERYQDIEPKNKDEEARVASRIVQAYAALEDLDGLVSAQEVVALNRDAVGPYAALAQYAYLAGQTRKGDLAAKKALELEDPDQRATLKSDLDSYKASSPAAVPSVTAAPSASATASPKDGGKSADKGKQSEKSAK